MPIDKDGVTKVMAANHSHGSPSADSSASEHVLTSESSNSACFSQNSVANPNSIPPGLSDTNLQCNVADSPGATAESATPVKDSNAILPDQHINRIEHRTDIVDEFSGSGQESNGTADEDDEAKKSDDTGREVTAPNPYGVGADVHRDFIYVTVLVKRDGKIFSYENTFETTIPSLKEAKSWCINTIESHSNPPVKVVDFCYTCESTASYHFPLLDTWGGNPAVVNPTLAKQGRRKTDRLDSNKLADLDLQGAWPRTFVIPTEIHELRSLIRERDHYLALSTKINNRVINTLTRFGCTISREGSVTKNDEVRSIVEGILSDPPVVPDEFCAMAIPNSMREMLRESLQSYDEFAEKAAYYYKKVLDKTYEIQWEVGEEGHKIYGKEAIDILATAPQVGEYSAIVFLANIITPFRFPNAKAMAAYCGLDPSIQTSANKKTSGKGRGGNKTLHYLLTSAANRLLRTHNEMFGEWGHRLTLQGTSHNKARNAVARKLAVAMYYMLLYEKPFSYDKYTLTQSMVYLDIPLEELVMLEDGFRRYVKILNTIGVKTTADLIRAYVTCNLDHVGGLGPKFFKLTKDLLANQKEYRRKYNELANGVIEEE